MAQSGPAKSKVARDAWLRALSKTAKIGERGEILPQVIERLALEFGAAPALIGASDSLNFVELAQRANRYARFARAQGFVPGDTVALYMHNCPDYVAAWLGLTRCGCVAALVNTQLSGELLSRALRTAQPKAWIVGAEFRDCRAEGLRRFVAGGAGPAGESLEGELSRHSGEALRAHECAVPALDATALYIYTSGTTGLPKAAKVSHYRLMQWSHWFAGMMDTQPSDRLFNCLPLYHSVGGVVAVFAPLVNGGSVVIRPRFSASAFWQDVRTQGCTLFQYIGELCRFLVNSAPQAQESEHALRLACGNGLRAEVWRPFQERFRIPHILEYYASTEGNFSLYNCEEELGAVGRIPAFLASRASVSLLRIDMNTGQPRRDAGGRCERCAPLESGEAVGHIPQLTHERAGRFDGYADPAASEQKVLRDVFEEGDAWYRTGDLMRCDERGFFYFVDRIGDTYRWKGENVSTQEVAAVLGGLPGVQAAVVYGVAVPGADGRAGMAALVVDKGFDAAAFRAQAVLRLPHFARPVFLRLVPGLEATGTFKPRKQQLTEWGLEPDGEGEVFVDEGAERGFVPLDGVRLAAIKSGAVRF